MEIIAHTISEAYSKGLEWLLHAGVEEPSRNGPVLVSPEPVMTVYRDPQRRVLFSPLRDANPFFHLLGDALWCLAGRSDVAWPVYFNKRYREYSDDGVGVWGAYGRRWQDWFGYDQLWYIAEELRRNPSSRRAVLAMWGATRYKSLYPDLFKAMDGGKDVPCNTHVYFDARDGRLNITVCCRSNDVWWGAYGANVVQFGLLQEMMAAWVGVPVGVYRQFSNNFHLYTALVAKNKITEYAAEAERTDEYVNGTAQPFPLVTVSIQRWRQELNEFMVNPQNIGAFTDPFFVQVAVPMYCAWHERKHKASDGLRWAEKIAASDWRTACVNWIKRRAAAKVAQQEA